MEALHTLLLGPYKYLLRDWMGHLTKVQQKEIQALISSFSFSVKLSRNIAKYFKSFVGRDFKILAQLALFILPTYLTPSEIEVWFAFSKAHHCSCTDMFLSDVFLYICIYIGVQVCILLNFFT